MPGIANDDAVGIAPFGDDRVPGSCHRTPEHVQPGTEISDACRGERTNAAWQCGHDDASARMSFSTPAAVTAGPAPGPVMISGFV